MNDYPIDPGSHFQRAVNLLLEGGTSHLVYASLELRLGTEARQHQYAEGWEHIPKKYRKAHHGTKDLGQALERAFKTEDQVLRLIYHFKDGHAPITLYYMPISRELRRVCDQLGNYLHAHKWQVAYDKGDENWIDQLRHLVITGIIHLHVALSGQLLGPAMMGNQDGKRQITTMALLPENDETYDALKDRAIVGSNMTLQVDYFKIEEFVAPLQTLFEDVTALRDLAKPSSGVAHRAEALLLPIPLPPPAD
jgi:hypothetical protein